MSISRKLKLLLSYDIRTIALLVEATCYMGWARYQLLYRPFSGLAARLGEPMKETGYDETEAHRKDLARVRHALSLMSEHTFWESKCLVRAVAGMKMLERRGIESTLYLGTAKNETGGMIAHAWLRSGPWYITGAEEMKLFTVTGKFARTMAFESQKAMNV
ncbi:lasso peptide biosynthesis B2 protein [Paenibacillus sp. 1011MAR3C5]|uniref:lasso peptide biosynthesis B2 protein n=1 Tax=Paenibacillus sp. 1011MAR3C5 TaxID=1675787 RepID=UPI000E6C39E0|nr:lasso peptide biosynthesis B2 protein [Paenibacillus sp. 1011MAR3C5]RJE91139.1 lasso peptide biosynthesis B2 protein [Paenibacillus sp. 1011MAR3C5]